MLGVIASLPSLYTLHYLDEATHRDSATQSGLAPDPEFPLTSYPSMDATIATVRADPYNPKTNGSLVRYPAMTGFDLAELDYGRLQAQQLVAPMAPNLAEKFFNIRGVVTEDDQQTPKNTTLGHVTCDWIPTSFDSYGPLADRRRRKGPRGRYAAGLGGAPGHECFGPLHHRQGQ